MPDNDQPSFSQDELEDIKRAAEIMSMTVDELVSHSTNRYVKRVKEDARKLIYNPKAIKIIK